ncbi:branched-chain amino acid ABC transporter permease [Azospirillum rugosum]|uniref:Branched-chain amino acid transport system permease protein n=1 Tax=Azospirillum rugosum TaxID=416170 RepID=A0ABS4SHS1_9PROT|nr:branched-chain amino acid ABC transporter permease [Azospirillum rugosum]MBP2290965.1 branched-chain amino acid transport system permease protein [Azospirillum rugosum]MDQ0524971.1 branched-chain amino acid transport system permease protein [Azospirillum rugosum]
MSKRILPLALPLVVALAVLVLVPALLQASGSGYLFRVSITAMIFAILAASLNFITGVAGLLSLGHAAFYGIGAYAAALLATQHGVPFLLTIPLAGVAAAIGGVLVALPTMRLVSIYFAVATLGMGEIIHGTLLNWVDFTRGPMGIPAIPSFKVFGLDLSGNLGSYLVVAVVMLASLWVLHRLTHSYYGNALRALREDDQCADSMGIDVVRLKGEVFAIACFFAGVAGALWAHTTGYISPNDFRFGESILVLAMIVVGGLGSLPGAVIGAVLLIVLPEALRPVGDVRMIVVGCVMFFSILLLPKGLFGEVSALNLVRSSFGGGWKAGTARQSIGWR